MRNRRMQRAVRRGEEGGAWRCLRIRAAVVLGFMALLGSVPASWAQAASEESVARLREVISQVEGGDLEGAIEKLERDGAAEAASPLTALLGTLYLESGRVAEAFAVLGPMAKETEADPAVLYNAARAALRLGNRAEGEELLTRSAAKIPLSPAGRELGLLRGRQGSTTEAYRLLRPWALANPGDFEARQAAAICALQLERPAEAEELLADLPQDQPRVRLLWARLLMAKDDPRAAIATLAPLEAEVSAEIEGDLRRTLGEAYLLTGRSDLAVAQLSRLSDSAPSDALLLAQAHYQNGDPEKAQEALGPFAGAVLEKPAEAWKGSDRDLAAKVALELGRARVASGDPAAAVEALEKASELDPWEKQIWQQLGQALAASGRRDEATRALEEFRRLAEAEASPGDRVVELEQDARDPTGKVMREAQLWLGRGEPQRALELARRENGLAPDDLRPRFVEVQALLMMRQVEEAAAAAEATLLEAPGNADAQYQLGLARMAQERMEEAEAALRKALELAPEHTAALNDLAVLLLAMDRVDEGRQMLERVLALRPDDPVAKANLARIEGR